MTRFRYVPALRWHWLTPAYDLVMRGPMREGRFKRALVDQAGLGSAVRVLDVGCGTGTMTCMLAAAAPGARVCGLDADARVLARAKRRARRRGLRILWSRGDAASLPFADRAFDRVVSCLLLHHLRADAKRRALAEWRRVLRDGGTLHVVDWTRPRSLAARVLFSSVRLFDGYAATRDHAAGRIAALCSEAGFEDVQETRAWTTPIGTLGLWRAARVGLSGRSSDRTGAAGGRPGSRRLPVS